MDFSDQINGRASAEEFAPQQIVAGFPKAANDCESDPIAEVLQGEAKEKYITLVRQDIRERLVNGLRNTARWQKNGYILDPNFQENNLDHVVGLLQWANEIESTYPDLWRELCDGDPKKWRELLQMIILHDIGETEPKVGDLSRSNPKFKTREGRLHKRKEAYAAYLMMGKYLPWPMVEENRQLYHRFDVRRPDDKLAMIGHVLDKGQATQRIPYHVIPFNLENAEYDLAEKIDSTQSDTLEYAQKLMANLTDTRARQQLQEFLTDKVIGHYDRLKVPSIDQYQRQIRAKFPAVFNP
jgi:hypothetical protein